MKKLELNQMGVIDGGYCNPMGNLGNGISGAGVIFAAGEILACATPAGWFFLGLSAAAFAAGVASCK